MVQNFFFNLYSRYSSTINPGFQPQWPSPAAAQPGVQRAQPALRRSKPQLEPTLRASPVVPPEERPVTLSPLGHTLRWSSRWLWEAAASRSPVLQRSASHRGTTQRTTGWASQRIKAYCLQPPRKLTACLRKQQTTHNPTDSGFFPQTCSSNRVIGKVSCIVASRCKKQSSTFLPKEWSKITGQKVTSAHLVWTQIVLLNQILFLVFLIGSLSHSSFNVQNLNVSYCCQLPERSEHHSQPDSHPKSPAGILQSNAICNSFWLMPLLHLWIRARVPRNNSLV